MDRPNSLNISEQFYSIQGEGDSVGVPAYFIRLKNCNLLCGGTNGKLVGKSASWNCDTEAIWKQGERQTYEQVIDKMQKIGQLERILDGRTHIVWTGGEPTLPEHRQDIAGFMDYLNKRYGGHNTFNEIETNGSIDVGRYFFNTMQQVNCSPKLRNSGMPEHLRLNRRTIEKVRDHENGWFKFVVNNERDIEEARLTYINPIEIPEKQVILMPGADNLKDLPERTRFIMEMCKKYGYRASTRMHILGYDKTVGV